MRGKLWEKRPDQTEEEEKLERSAALRDTRLYRRIHIEFDVLFETESTLKVLYTLDETFQQARRSSTQITQGKS